MYITCITHAAAREKKYAFRGLTAEGWREVDSAAERFLSLVAPDVPKIDAIISSPKARCVETAVLFAKAISSYVAVSEIGLNSSLKAGSIAGTELVDLANSNRGQHLLVAAHADIVKALPKQIMLIPEAASGDWFSTRPVLFHLEYEPSTAWNTARIAFCDGLLDGHWQDLLR